MTRLRTAKQIPLAVGDVHVWCATLTRTANELAELTPVLSNEELERALQLRSDTKRIQFIVARSMLRMLISKYVDVDPKRLQFGHGPQGKPFLHPPLSSLQFNVSHTHGRALFAFAWEVELGVDVERIRSFDNYLGFANRYFSSREVELLHSLPTERRMEAFFHVWTRKEAFLKATGEGISSGLDRVEVTVDPQAPCRLERLNGCPNEATNWTLQALHPETGYVGALCTRPREGAVTCLNWTASSTATTIAVA